MAAGLKILQFGWGSMGTRRVRDLSKREPDRILAQPPQLSAAAKRGANL